MASIAFLSVLYWGADYIQITEGDGVGTVPQVVSATPLSRNEVKVTFDSDMLFGVADSEVLRCQNYYIEDHDFSKRIYVLRIEKISDIEVLLITQDHEGLIYDLTVTNVQNKYGVPIGLSNNTAQYVGINPNTEFPVATSIYSFWGHYAGMESTEDTGIVTDINPPYTESKSPTPSLTQVDRNTIISFHIKDDDTGVDLSVTKIYVEGNLAYDGPTSTWLAPFNVGSSITGTPADYTVTINRSSSYDSYKLVLVHVVAGDLRPLPNYLHESWSFRIEDYAAPDIASNNPTGIDANKDTNISFTVRDVDGSGVNQSLLNTTVDGDPAIVNGAFVSPYNGGASSITPNASVCGFDVVIDKTSSYASFHDVAIVITAVDNEGNSGGGSWSFRTEDYEGPLVIPVDPYNGEPGVGIFTNITVKLQDDQEIQGNTSIVEIDVNGGGFEVAWEEGGTPEFKPGWDGPGSGVVTESKTRIVTIDQVSFFPFAATVTVRVTSEDIEGNPERI
ncbi:MAG: hypothetical protein ACFFFC_00035 [Candidatus Thorarchaeota archaeon]